ncbi:MAG: SpoIIE family protein phosphatase [Deltaproteobacteria bacterium]|nr:SpoIIE family protein phosphatase [Deltaproteobacteria bacterium]
MTISLNDLRESNDFLNILFEKIPALVMLMDQDMQIQEVNDAYQILFGKTRDEALGRRCGNALGCIFAVTERKLCGDTSHCNYCSLRRSAQDAFLQHVPTDRKKLSHTFIVDSVPTTRFFEYSTRYISFKGREMILLILYDVTVLEIQKADLITKQLKLDEDLKASGAIQQGLLPMRLPDTERVTFAWKFQPCDAVGGDILNVLSLDKDHIGIYLLDVAGHGAPSAMISLLVYQLMNPHTGVLLDNSSGPADIRSPEAVLEILEREFPFRRFRRHFTIIYMVLDLSTGQLTYSNAAHCTPVVVRQEGMLELLTVSGPVIGVRALPFGQGTTPLKPGDKVVLYSDGVIETRNAANELFGEDRLQEMLTTLSGSSPSDLAQGIYAAVDDFRGTQSPDDDLSVLVFQYKGEMVAETT